MAIHLNLLAEAQAAEDMRRKDPVKRAVWISALLISSMLVWSSSLQLKAMLANGEVSRMEAQIHSQNTEFKQVIDNQKKIEEITGKLGSLQLLTSNRFLHATLLDSLQRTNSEDVSLVHFKAEQTYVATEAVKPRTNDNRVIPGKPGSVTEKITVTLDGNDSSANPGDQVGKYKDAIAGLSYFQTLLSRTNMLNLKSLSGKQLLPTPGSTIGKPCVLFTLECRFPDRTR
jgi:hypothetical protein